MSDFDFCIIGAGPAGSASAWQLARAGFRVALFDRARFPRDKTCGDGITPRGARALQRLGVLEAVRAKAYACSGVNVRASDAISYSIPFRKSQDHPNSAQDREPSDLLVLPRYQLDDILLQHALSAGPTFFENTKIVDVREGKGKTVDYCKLQTEDGRIITCKLAIFATGAESQLLRTCKLLADKPPLEHAARVYFDNVTGLKDEVILFFDGVDQPGYGWIFPTSPTSANIGCGVFARVAMSQTERLKQLIAQHPLLQTMLANARQSAPLKAYPLRTDFKPEYAGHGRKVCIGEAAGLVNPVTGEGIDYALESAEFLTAAILQHCKKNPSRIEAERIVEAYRQRLTKRFKRRFALYRFVQRHALNDNNSARLLAQVQRAPALQRIVVDGLFGRGRPADFFKPEVLLHVARMMFSRS
jgi:geranylgeranyl reductase family protein